jgi:hypothetical protein
LEKREEYQPRTVISRKTLILITSDLLLANNFCNAGCHELNERLVRVKAWEEFKRLVIELKPDSLVYIIEQNGLTPTREMTVLRLILPAKNGYYIYLDFPKANALRETALPIHDNKGNRHLEDDDIKRFLKREFGEKMPIFSYWTT